MFQVDSGGLRAPIGWLRRMPAMTAAVVANFLAFSILFNSASAQSHIRTIALTGQQAPGFSPGAVFQPGQFFPYSFSTPVINGAGNVAFRAKVQTEEGVLDAAYMVKNGNFHLIAQSGQSLPGLPPGQTIAQIDVANLGEDNSVFLRGVAGAFEGYWRERDDQFDFVVGIPGVQPPVTHPGTEFTSLGSIRFNNGAIVFQAWFKEQGVPTGTHGVWAFDDALRQVVRQGSEIPGMNDDTVFGQNSAQSLFINGHGQAIFIGGYRNFSSGSQGAGTFIGTPDLLQMIVSTDAPAPGTQQLFRGLGSPRLNDASQIAFRATTDGGQAGIWSNRSGQLAPVVLEGTHLPGLSDVLLDSVDGNGLIINSKGLVTFTGILEGTGVTRQNELALLSEGLGGLHIVARNGDQMPDMVAGEILASIVPQYSTNALGQTAFRVFFVNPSTRKTGYAILAEDLAGSLHLIAADHHTIEVSPGDIRTVQLLWMAGTTGGEDGMPEWFNDSGQIAFAASFTDGSSGVFVSDLVAIPEPSSILIAILGLAASAAVYRRRRTSTGATLKTPS